MFQISVDEIELFCFSIDNCSSIMNLISRNLPTYYSFGRYNVICGK